MIICLRDKDGYEILFNDASSQKQFVEEEFKSKIPVVDMKFYGYRIFRTIYSHKEIKSDRFLRRSVAFR